MATKSGLLTTINGYITAIITQANHRLSMSSVVDELYPTQVTDDQTTETYTTKAGTNILYDVVLHKSGNQTLMKLRVKNNTTGALGSQNVLAWKESEYKPLAVFNALTVQAWQGANRISLLVNNGGISLTSSMNPSSNYYETDFIPYINQV